MVAKTFLHMWEEPCISGEKGSGTVFFSGCNLRCVFCQNYKISQLNIGKEVSNKELAEILVRLQDEGAHNINLVNPTHFIPQIKASLELANLNIPIVYNSNGYESLEGLKLMEGVVNVYLPDLKYCDDSLAVRYSEANGYWEIATKAILDMYRQVGVPKFDEDGMVKRGLIVRHLVLPGMVAESIKVLKWIKENLPGDVYVSVMGQYVPYYKAGDYPEINRRVSKKEYDRVVNYMQKIGLENGYVQERQAADMCYIPEF